MCFDEEVVKLANENKLVYSFPKNSLEEVRARITEYKGHRLIDIRSWVENKEGGRVATKKGITLSVELLPELRKAISELERVLEEGGADE